MTTSAFAARHILAPKPPAVVAPPPVSGYTAWYDSSQIAGQADNTPLAAWPDMSGHGYHLAQPSAGARPTFYSSTAGQLVNGKPAVWFTGSNQAINTSGFPVLAQPFTVLGVVGYSKVVSGPWNSTLGSGVQAILVTTGTSFLYAGANLFGVTTPLGAAHVFTGLFNGPASSIALDNAAVAGNPGAGGLGPTFFLGGDSSGNYMNGSITEVIVYPSALAVPNVTAVYNYLKTKWGTP